MKKLNEVIERMRNFDFEDDVYDCHEVMNRFADDVQNAVAYECSCCNLLIEDRKLIDKLKKELHDLQIR